MVAMTTIHTPPLARCVPRSIPAHGAELAQAVIASGCLESAARFSRVTYAKRSPLTAGATSTRGAWLR